MPSAEKAKKTRQQIVAERGLPPLDSVWKYDRSTAIVVVHPSPTMRDGYLLDVYLRFNSRQGGFDTPVAGVLAVCRSLTQLRTHEFWGLVDLGLLERIDPSEES